MKLLKFTRHTRLRVTLSLLMVLALVFGCVGAFAGEAMALGGTVNDGDCVLIRGVKSGKNLMILGGLDNATNQPNIILYDAHDDYGSQKWLVKKLTVSGREYT
ncbi:MAG: hypothetical protein LBN05_01535, partial [Oscillospiraceae bacterium]|nr:hypothetical protein [Oscillospiraceae bacterium]